MVLLRNKWEPDRELLLAHWRALAPADAMYELDMGPQSTSTIVARSIHAESTADYSTEPESTARQREGAVPTLGNRRVCGLVWGLCFVAVATGMPLRATGDYFLDGCEYCCLFA